MVAIFSRGRGVKSFVDIVWWISPSWVEINPCNKLLHLIDGSDLSAGILNLILDGWSAVDKAICLQMLKFMNLQETSSWVELCILEIVLFHSYFSTSVEQLARNNQLPIVQQYFTNIAAI